MVRDHIPILLVEDDVIDVRTVQRAFKKNYFVNPLSVVGNGEEALQFLRHEGAYSPPGDAPRPGIILLDLNMPIMNGLEFLHEVKDDDELKCIPVIVLTTSQEEGDRTESFRHSVAGYIVKPVDFNKFVDAIKSIKLYWTLSELP